MPIDGMGLCDKEMILVYACGLPTGCGQLSPAGGISAAIPETNQRCGSKAEQHREPGGTSASRPKGTSVRLREKSARAYRPPTPRRISAATPGRIGAVTPGRNDPGENQRGDTTAPSSPGPVWAPMTAPTSVTRSVSRPGTRSRSRSARAAARSAAARWWTAMSTRRMPA